MGFWNPAVLVGDAQRRGLKVLPVDLEHSQSRCTVEQGSIRLGFNYVAGFGETAIARLEEARQTHPFTDLADFCRRTHLPRRIVEKLILVGAMDRWGISRRTLLWELGQLRYQEEELELIFPQENIPLPSLLREEKFLAEVEILGLSTDEHVMAHYRDWLSQQGILSIQELATCPAESRVRVAGLLVVHQSPPTAKGFHFLTLEDETGLLDVIVRPQIYAHYRRLLHTSYPLIVEGTVQREIGVVNLLAVRVVVLAQQFK